MATTLNGIALPDDCLFINRHNYMPYAHSNRYSLSGDLVIDRFKRKKGELIKLDCRWITQGTLDQIKALPDEPMVLVLADGSVYNVMLDHSQQAIESEYVIDYADIGNNGLFAVTLNLIEV